jgi:hypothetical protein
MTEKRKNYIRENYLNYLILLAGNGLLKRCFAVVSASLALISGQKLKEETI